MSLLQNSNAISEGGYNIANSLRFQSASSQYLSRTFGVPTNAIKWTVSAWVKRGQINPIMDIFGSYVGTSTYGVVDFRSDNTLTVYATNTTPWVITSSLYRDPSAWYHIVIRYDSANATASNRLNIYVNGVECSYSTDNRASYQNQASGWNRNGTTNGIGAGVGSINGYLDGYITEFYHVDGQALTPSAFGETDTLTGQWVAKKYTGTYGNNGFYLPFSNGTSTTTLGYDSSGNSNNWTLTNFTRAAGTSDCWMYDVPSGNGIISGTQPNSNYCVVNPLINTNSFITVLRGNLSVSSSPADKIAFGTMAIPLTGKFYYEYTVTTVGNATAIGLCTDTVSQSSGAGFTNANARMYQQNATKYNGATSASYGASFTTGDLIGVAIDMDAGTITFYKNNVSQGTAYSDLAGITFFPAVYINGSVGNFNFGQRSFAYTPPSGFKALCTANLPTATIKKGNTVFDATLYTGNGGNQNLTNINFQPDIFWGKSRSSVNNHGIVDVIRGGLSALYSNLTNAETSDGIVTSFNSNGVSLGNSATTNSNGQAYVGWAWDAGSSTVTNTNGTISSQVRANPTAGVSVVTWTPLASAGTVGHGLGIAPSMVIIKQRNSADNWYVYHKSNGAGKYILLNTTAATVTNATVFSTTPTSSVFDAGTGNTTANYGAQVAYCFAEIAGFSKFGSYVGNGSADGTFVYTGFRPKYVMIKRTDATGEDWQITDTSRSPFNAAAAYLYPNLANAEGGSSFPLDVLSNGFKLRNTTGNNNVSGATYIYACFAESPFANSNAR